MAVWIDGTYDLGSLGFRIDRSTPGQGETTTLSQRPAHTNQSHQPRLYGWCGSSNNTNTYANGVWKVTRVASNGRVQICEVTDHAEVEAWLDSVGFPDLADQHDATALGESPFPRTLMHKEKPMSQITPCPQCGSIRLDISVKTEAVQRIQLHTPSAARPDVYTYTIEHEDVSFKDVTSAFCTQCPYEWVIDENA